MNTTPRPQHTPGPCIARKMVSGHHEITEDATGRRVGTIDREFNAHLFAAAPDLLEALREADRFIVVARKYFPKNIQHSDRFQLENVNRAARAALTKVEG